MAENFYDKIKKQIKEQTRDKLNIRLNAPTSVKFKSDRPEGQEDSVPDPIWVRTHYTYDRGSSFPIDVISFKDYYGNVFGPTDVKYENGSFYDVDFEQYINVRYRIDVWCEKPADIPLSWKCAEGNIHLSFVDASTHTGTITVLHSNSLVEAGSDRLVLEANKWLRLNLCYYCDDDDGYLKFTCALKDHIAAWRYSDLTPPAIPEWASPTIETSLLDPQTGASKVSLYWARNTEEDFAGNGIYRRTVVDSGIPAAEEPVDDLFLANAFYVEGRVSATLKTGSSILINNTGTIYSLDRIDFRPANLQPNGDFHNNWNNWNTSGTISLTPTQFQLAYKSAKLEVGGTSDVSSITSTFLAVATSNNYEVSYSSSFNFIPNEGFEVGATGWGNIGSDFTIATTGAFYGNKYLSFVSPAAATYCRCDLFSVKQDQLFNVSCYASTATRWNIMYIEAFGANTKTIIFPTSGKWKYTQATFKATGNASCQIRLGNMVGGVGREVWFDNVSVFPSSYQGVGTNTQITENITTYFYDSGKVACGTASQDQALFHDGLWGQKHFVLSRSASTDVSSRMPSDCSYLKIKFDLTCGGTFTEQARLFLDGVYVRLGVDSYDFNPTTVDVSFLSVDETVTQSPSGNVYQVKYEHRTDRDLTPTDTGVITWNDGDVQSGETYGYVLDAYDIDGNRSLWSSEASIVAGDIFAPGTVRGLAGEADYLCVNLTWTNPTSEDYLGAKVYVTSTLDSNLYAHELGLPDEKEALVVGGLAVDTEYKFLVLSYDQNHNTNTISPLPSVNVTTLTEPEGEVNKVVDITFDDHPTLGEERLYYSKGTFNFYTHFSETIEELTDITVNVIDEGSNNLFVSNSLNKVGTGPTVNVAGSFNVTAANPEGWVNLKVQASDVNASVHYGVRAFTIDKTVPNMVQLAINRDEAYTESLNVELRIRADGQEVCFSNYYVSGSVSAIPGTVSPWYPNGSIFQWKLAGLVNDPESKSVYGWTRDLALNVSANYTDAIAYLGGVSPETVIFFLDAKGGNRIEPNEFGWFNQVIFATFETKTFGYSLATIWYRNNFGAFFWSAWSSILVSNFVATTLDYDGTIEVEAYCVTSGGLRSSVARETAYQDKVNPEIDSNDLWTRGSSRIQGAWMSWDESKLTDALSGMAYSRVYRSETTASADATLVAKINYPINYYRDQDDTLNPYDTYYYFLRAEDKANNIGSFSTGTGIVIYPNYKEEYSNYLDNSNFERIGFDGHPISWEVRDGIPATVTGTIYMGKKSIKIGNSNLYQTEYTYLPAHDNNRNFVISSYILGSLTVAEGVYVGFNFYDIDNSILSTVFGKYLGALPTVSDGWERVEALVPAASIPVNAAHCQIYLYPASPFTAVFFADCVQFEEKDSLPASEYNETKTISGDRMMAHFIRGDMIEAESIRTTELAADCITASLVAANAIVATNISANAVNATHIQTEELVVDSVDESLGQIRVGSSDDYHTLLKNRGMVFKKGTSEYGVARRVHEIQDVQVGTIKYENYSVASFDSVPKVLLYPRIIKTYEAAWATGDQYNALYAENVTATHFEAKAILHRGSVGGVYNATFNNWQNPSAALRLGGEVGTAQYRSNQDALIYSFNASANKMQGYVEWYWENNTRQKKMNLRIHTIVGEYDTATSRMVSTVSEKDMYLGYGYAATGTYSDLVYTQPLSFATTYDVKVSVCTYWQADFPAGSLSNIKVTNWYYKHWAQHQDITDARVDCLIIET